MINNEKCLRDEGAILDCSENTHNISPHFWEEDIAPQSRSRIWSLRAKRSNLAFGDEIAMHLSGARKDGLRKGFPFLNWNLAARRWFLKGLMSRMVDNSGIWL